MSCNVIQNIYNTLLSEGLIDSKHNIIGSVSETYNKINQINNEVKRKYGATKEIVTTGESRGYLGKGTLNKIDFNQKIGDHIDGVDNKTNKIFSAFTKPTLKSSEILDVIVNANDPLSDLAKHLIPFTKKNDVNVSIVSPTELDNPTWQGVYNDITNDIKISESAINKTAYRTIIHEIIHALTVNEIEKNPNSQAVKDLTKIFEDTKWLSGDKSLYGYTNVKEFAVGVMTDPKVMRDMKNMPASANVNTSNYKNLFEQVINKLLEAIGIKKNRLNIYDQATAIVSTIINDTSLYNNTEVLLSNKEEQELWDSIISKYEDRNIDESDFNDDWSSNNIEDDVEGLNAPTPPPSPSSLSSHIINNYPDSFAEWINSRKKALDNLKKLHDQYFKLNRRDPILKDVNLAIEELNSQLDIADVDNPFTIYSSAVEEAEIIKILLDKAMADPDNSLAVMETNDLENRINDLNFYFLGLDKRIGDTSYGENNLSNSQFYTDFMDEFGHSSSDEMKVLQDMIRGLKEDHKNTKKKLVLSAFKNNSYVKQHIASGKLTVEQVQLIITKIENNEFEVDSVGSWVLGLASNGGILGQLLYTQKEEASFKENAYAGSKATALSKLWEKIKDAKDAKGGFLINSLFQHDQFGVITNRLISKYNDSFSNITKLIYNEKSVFATDKNSTNYSIWMKAEKDNFHRIDVRKLSSVFDRYSTDPKYSKYFTGIDMAASLKYEQELKDRLGPIMYEIEKNKAEEMLEDYIFNVDTHILTPRQIAIRNPFAFLQHFDSAEFDKMSLSESAFLEPAYTRFIPKLDANEYYNDQFSVVEDNKDLAEYYAGAHDAMTNYANPTFQGEGVNVGSLDLQTFEDMLDRNAYKDLTLFGKIGANLKAIKRDRIQRYSDSTLANMEERLNDENHDRKKLVVGHSGEVKNRISRLKNVYENLPFKELVDKAKQKGLIGVELSDKHLYIKTGTGGADIKTPLFYALLESLARAELNSVTSTNIQESIHNSLYLAADVRARRSVVGMLEAFKDLSQSVGIRKGNSIENKLGDTNIHKMLRMWGQSNVYGEKFAGDMEDKGSGITSKIARQKVFGLRTLTGTDKLTLKEIEKVLKTNPVIVDTFQDVDGAIYQSKGGLTKTVNGVIENITVEEFRDAYMKNMKKTIGTEITIGSLMIAQLDNLIAMHLGISPRAGIKNRLAGMSQTMSVAASGRFGFNLNEYHSSRRFLRGINTRQYASNLGWDVNESNPKYIQVKMLEELVNNLGLEQNRADELAMEARFNTNTGTNKIKSIQNFFMDFSMNNPEKHNQLEIAVAIMMGTTVKDIKGNPHKLFDEKKQEFNIYKAGTLELKDEFKTAENETMWEKFQTYKDSATGEQNSDSIAMTTKIRGTIEQTQGNYNRNDIIMLQNSVVGKLGTMYTRFFYENTNIQFGKHFLDLRTGELNIKGRKRNMFEHAPTSMVYLMGSWSLPIMAGAVTFAAMSPWIAGAIGISGALGIGYLIKSKQFKLEGFGHWKEYQLAKDFALETLLLMGKSPLNTFSYGKVNPKFFDNNIEKLKGKSYDGLLTDKERALLSECAQEIATKFQNYTTYTLLSLLAKFAFLAMVGGDDDEDETAIQRKIKEMVNIENVVNALLNDRNQMMNDINRYINPSQFYDDATGFSYFRSVAREGNTLYKIANGKYEDEDSSVMWNDIAKLSFIPGLNMIPNNAKKAVTGMFNKDVGVFSDDRVYQGKDAIDTMIGKEMKKGEDYYKADATEKRAALKSQVVEYFKQQLKDEISENDLELNTAERKEEIDKRVSEFMKETKKARGNSYENLVTSEIFEEKQRQLDEMKNSK